MILATPVNRFLNVLQSFLRVKNGFKLFPFDVKQRQRFNRRGFVHSSNAGHQIADVSNLFHGHGVFVFGDRKNAESIGGIGTG